MDDLKLNEIAGKAGASVSKSSKSIVLTASPERVLDLCRFLKQELPDFYHLSTISGFDEGNTIGVLYHFWKGKEFLSIKTSVPKENATLDSISDIFPASLLYEAEVKDMLGVIFKGNPVAKQRLLLPDAYPVDAPPPLRKEADPERIRKMMNLE